VWDGVFMLQQIGSLGKSPAVQPGDEPVSSMKRSTQEFDDLMLRHDHQVAIRQPTASEIESLLQTAAETIGVPLASPEVIGRVLAWDPESIWIFEHSGRVRGGFAFLFLNTEGVTRLRADKLDTRNPTPEHLVAAGEPPAGCYWWLGVRLDRGPNGISKILEFLRSPRFRGSDFWMNPFTDDGRAFATKMGFRRDHSSASPTLYRYVRKANRAAAREG
jgi:hypothetical protein